MALKRQGISPEPSVVIPLRMKGHNVLMLDKLAEAYNTPKASVLRMALKQLYDRTFPQEGGTIDVQHAGKQGK